MTNVNLFLFDGFETLDLFGPVEILARVPDFHLDYYSFDGGTVTNAQGVQILTKPMADADSKGIFVIPGGRGTRPLAKDGDRLALIRKYCEEASVVLSICTGSAVLAACGVLDGYRATSNKKAFEWAQSCGSGVLWQKKARWCADGKFYTSSGVSAGMDMALGFVSDRFGLETALKISDDIEYIWNQNHESDPFCR